MKHLKILMLPMIFGHHLTKDIAQGHKSVVDYRNHRRFYFTT